METPLDADCWKCGYRFEGTTAAFEEGEPPSAGCISVCLNCGALAIFVDRPTGLGLRKPTPAEMLEYGSDPQIISLQIFRAHVVDENLNEKNSGQKAS
jgi:hypothetical protein